MCSTNNGAGYCLAVTSGQANPHVNTGAMVDGPDISDGYNDERSYMSMAGVHLDNNAGLSGEPRVLRSCVLHGLCNEQQ